MPPNKSTLAIVVTFLILIAVLVTVLVLVNIPQSVLPFSGNILDKSFANSEHIGNDKFIYSDGNLGRVITGAGDSFSSPILQDGYLLKDVCKDNSGNQISNCAYQAKITEVFGESSPDSIKVEVNAFAETIRGTVSNKGDFLFGIDNRSIINPETLESLTFSYRVESSKQGTLFSGGEGNTLALIYLAGDNRDLLLEKIELTNGDKQGIISVSKSESGIGFVLNKNGVEDSISLSPNDRYKIVAVVSPISDLFKSTGEKSISLTIDNINLKQGDSGEEPNEPPVEEPKSFEFFKLLGWAVVYLSLPIIVAFIGLVVYNFVKK